jgi:oligopeptidase B
VPAYAYGSYGISSNVTFSSNRFSLVDRGVVYALRTSAAAATWARRGTTPGAWQNKMNTFTDFIACAEYLKREQGVRAGPAGDPGRQRGRLLMGAVTNLRPNCSRRARPGAVRGRHQHHARRVAPAHRGEFEEWGNPKVAGRLRGDEDVLAVRQLHPRPTPHAGQDQPQRQPGGFWEPAKLRGEAAHARHRREAGAVQVQHGRGHGGASGRYDALHEVAFDYAWVLNTLGAAGTKAIP